MSASLRSMNSEKECLLCTLLDYNTDPSTRVVPICAGFQFLLSNFCALAFNIVLTIFDPESSRFIPPQLFVSHGSTFFGNRTTPDLVQS